MEGYIPLTQHFDYIMYLDSVLRRSKYGVVQLVEVLRNKRKVTGSIPDEANEFRQWFILTASAVDSTCNRGVKAAGVQG